MMGDLHTLQALRDVPREHRATVVEAANILGPFEDDGAALIQDQAQAFLACGANAQGEMWQKHLGTVRAQALEKKSQPSLYGDDFLTDEERKTLGLIARMRLSEARRCAQSGR